jgi:hypothetical protein
MRRSVVLAELAPEIKNDNSLRNAVPAAIYQNFISGNPVGWLDRGRSFRWNDINVSVVEVALSVYVNDRVGIRFGNSSFDSLRVIEFCESDRIEREIRTYQSSFRMIRAHPFLIVRWHAGKWGIEAI